VGGARLQPEDRNHLFIVSADAIRFRPTDHYLPLAGIGPPLQGGEPLPIRRWHWVPFWDFFDIILVSIVVSSEQKYFTAR